MPCEVKGSSRHAVAEYREAIRLRPDDDNALYNFDKILTDQGKVDVLLAEYREMIRLHPDSGRRAEQPRLEARSRPDRPGRDYDEALVHARKCVALTPEGRQSLQHTGAGRVSCSPLGPMHRRRQAVNRPPEWRVRRRLVFPGHGLRAEGREERGAEVVR